MRTSKAWIIALRCRIWEWQARCAKVSSKDFCPRGSRQPKPGAGESIHSQLARCAHRCRCRYRNQGVCKAAQHCLCLLVPEEGALRPDVDRLPPSTATTEQRNRGRDLVLGPTAPAPALDPCKGYCTHQPSAAPPR